MASFGEKWFRALKTKPNEEDVYCAAEGLGLTVLLHEPSMFGLPEYPLGVVDGPCVCGSWPGGECFKCPIKVA